MIHELGNNEAVLLMYMAEELPDEDRLEVEQMLASDGVLRGQLDRLIEAHEFVQGRMQMLDTANLPPVDAEVATRRVGRLIRAWQARPAWVAATAPLMESPSLRNRAWTMPAAAAAMVLIVVGVAIYGPQKSGTVAVVSPSTKTHPITAHPDGVSSAGSEGDPAIQYAVAESEVAPFAPLADATDSSSIDMADDLADSLNNVAGRDATAEASPVFDIPLDAAN